MIAGEREVTKAWLLHIPAVAIVVLVVSQFSGLSALAYLVAAYLGMSLLMVRTFLEHQAHEKTRGRSVIIENGGLFGFLFLNNNLHAVHHAYPRVPWYELPGLYSRKAQRFQELNLGYGYGSYGDIFRRYAFRAKEPVPHPLPHLNRNATAHGQFPPAPGT